MAVDVSTFSAAVEQWASRVVDAWSNDLVEALRDEAPVAAPTGDPRQRPSGTLARAIHSEPVGPLTFRAVAPGIEAITTSKGAAPHVIRPRTAGVLLWYSGGEARFGREVHHPGSVGTGWFEQGIQRRGQETLLSAALRTVFR